VRARAHSSIETSAADSTSVPSSLRVVRRVFRDLSPSRGLVGRSIPITNPVPSRGRFHALSFNQIFGASFMPHVFCLRALDVIWSHVISYCLIVLTYGVIPCGPIQNIPDVWLLNPFEYVFSEGRKGEVGSCLQQQDRLILLAVRNYRSPTYLDNQAR